MPGGVSIPFKLDEESSPLRRAPFRAATLPKPKTPQSAEKLKKGFRKSAFRRTPRRKQIENDESKVVILPLFICASVFRFTVFSLADVSVNIYNVSLL